MLLSAKLSREIRACLHLAIPLAAAQVCEASTNFIDTVMMGWLGPAALAAGALGAITFQAFILVGIGLMSAVGALAAIAYGAGDHAQLNRVTVQGFWLAGAIALPAMLLISVAGAILQRLGQDPAAVRLMQDYLNAIVWGFPAAIGFSALKNVASALNRPRLVIWALFSGIAVNVIGNYLLAFGPFGLPALGLVGLGWASTLSFWVRFLILLWWIQRDRHLRPLHLLARWQQFELATSRRIMQIGLPSAVLFAVETALFTGATYLVGSLGTVPLAAHQIALQTAAMTFMVPVGIAYATTMRVGQHLGRGDVWGARRAGFVGIVTGAIFMTVTALLFWSFPAAIVGIYLNPRELANRETIELAIALLGVAAMFQLADGTQAIAAGALRGIKDTRIPMLIGIGTYWGIGFSSAWLFGFGLGWGSRGIWWGLALALLCAAIVLTWRFHQQTRHLLAAVPSV
ncbi:MAG: MATE family efflux transporter [Spirulinaceae cyanobacterium RM2_2_10]|nr:MATE family efflux transporter [Spirulinaceae cyanobacterium SM2_1_0]NJO21081.1 MATE family efflux transporter [Spirulinaceae cyanobacterium RM2_2_10]